MTTKTVLCLVAVMLTGVGCRGSSPVAPDDTQLVSPSAVQSATISGHVYAAYTWGEPLIAEALIKVMEADGSIKSTVADEDGFYQISVRPGNVAIKASKEGYEANSSRFTLLKDTRLNFHLIPN